MTDLSPHLPYGDISPTNNLSSGDFLHMTICHVEKFLHMADFFSTSTACGACDKYQVCVCVAENGEMLVFFLVFFPHNSLIDNSLSE